MTDAADEALAVVRYFVDEAGDPVLFGRRGRIIVGAEGCSRYFILGKLDVGDATGLATELEALRADLLADPYFARVPSMQPERRKTALAFHAKDDVPEVRREVYKVLLRHRLRFYAVVRNKAALSTFVRQHNERDPAYRYRQDEQYDLLVSQLFRQLRNMADEVEICFARRGTKPRNDALERALEEAAKLFEGRFGFRHPGRQTVVSSTPAETACLQAVDYFLWALQRFYERREDRFLELIWPQVGEVHDLDIIIDRRQGAFFTRDRPLTLAIWGEGGKEPGI